jgi:hypothetical protein
MCTRRWCLLATSLLCMGWACCHSIWSSPEKRVLTDAELQTLWGGSPALYCGMDNLPQCAGWDLSCSDFAAGESEGGNCIGPATITRYYNPESCGSTIYSNRVCNNAMNLSVACTATVRCVTIMASGRLFCSEVSYANHYVTINTDPFACLNLHVNYLLYLP